MTRFSGIFQTAPVRLMQVGVFALSMVFFAAPRAAFAGDEPGFLTRALGLRTPVPEAPEFVVKTRRQTEDFIPVHTPRPKPEGKPMPKEEVSKQEKALDSARLRQDRVAGRESAPVGKSVADGLDAKDPKAKAKANANRAACGLTCPNPTMLPSQSGKEAR